MRQLSRDISRCYQSASTVFARAELHCSAKKTGLALLGVRYAAHADFFGGIIQSVLSLHVAPN